MIFDEESLTEGTVQIVDPVDFTRRKKMSTNSAHIDMLLPIFRAGKLVYRLPDVPLMREYAANQISRLHPSIRRLLNPHQYPVGLESGLHNMKTDLIMRARAESENANS
jgi:nicotinate phosphoribosyltransferase